jgi:hypothetical protein
VQKINVQGQITVNTNIQEHKHAYKINQTINKPTETNRKKISYLILSKLKHKLLIIQFNSIQFIYVQNLTAQRPITKLAQARKWEE